MAYATVADVQDRLAWTMSEDQEDTCSVLLDDAAVLIDAAALDASDEAKKIVSCRMVIRALGDGGDAGGVPMGATQGSMSALGYSQSWTIGSGGATGELYLGKTDRQILGLGNQIGSYSPVQELVPEATT
ncbi:MAG: hypothetical protein IIW12_06150 [Oscillospiraceae bacterium]|nr:hypothetical protein [Oscillospiraceae bacterium]